MFAVCLVCFLLLGRSTSEAAERWCQIFEDKEAKVTIYLDSATFSSNLDKKLDE